MFKKTMIIEFVYMNKQSPIIAFSELKALSEIYKVNFTITKVNNKKLEIIAPIYFTYLILTRMSLLKKVCLLFNDADELIHYLSSHSISLIKFETFDGENANLLDKIETKTNKVILNLKEGYLSIKNTNRGILACFQSRAKKYLQRNPPYRPYSPPYTMDSLLSKLAINLARARPGCLFLDPFAGSGSFLIEAFFIGCYPIGIDISLDDLISAYYNARYFGAEITLIAGDSTTNLIKDTSIDCIATDPPYGRASRLTNKTIRLYNDFLVRSYYVLRKNRYLSFFHPGFTEINNIIKKTGFELINSFDIRVHKGLTRYLTVLYLR